MLREEAGRHQGQLIAKRLQIFLGPFEAWLDAQIDRRLVRTFFLALQPIVRFRHSWSGLLLSELGAHVLTPSQAPAGAKRLSNLLRSPRWSHTLLDRFLWHRADQALGHLGRERLGEAREHCLGMAVSGALQQSGPPQAGVLQSPADHRCSCLACTGSPVCTALRPWQPWVDGLAGASWLATRLPKRLPFPPAAPRGGTVGCRTSLTGDSLARHGSRS